MAGAVTMVSPYISLIQVALHHTYPSSGLSETIEMRPTRECAATMLRANHRWRPSHNGGTLYVTAESLADAARSMNATYTFTLHATSSLFWQYTSGVLGETRSPSDLPGVLYPTGNAGDLLLPRTERPSHLLEPRGLMGPPQVSVTHSSTPVIGIVEVGISADMAVTRQQANAPLVLSWTFAARETYWRYLLVPIPGGRAWPSAWEFTGTGELACRFLSDDIVDAVPTGTRAFISERPLALRERPSIADGVTLSRGEDAPGHGVLLPIPDPSRTFSRRTGTGADAVWISEMFVYV